ncbi:MAG: bifunctional phosphoribosyl-AMP cyclohydrolase/phosphoribosyl-ATP diphosphatase HisIE [Candidatus Marinimicrobia bacterium]|jgi:phosphoribosyl-ATP pyrophosphohydrolase/phosphoribosyl-AMP cyclohydrolase|nr:bifunctional phosphoribosyl-AMP cyclohydrolase/phosphoribosyl-ATP diphosphatase HisIE [Candidatus Neomarinimicrobiota bacterium]MCK9483900.1 bifunctional phosphoribosyl-AMP cyclohydrolase/phosphoribosyl-ATP diphosphatase HisIE [Candidatus Neomarinimicrobiota bacterium]MDD5230158.1 bifunctional phosphoribosyl-AMP cyclohydrolase/phosphoribosyl-ATP diphosphatase HisIE [Candidatus Neomarinimicrobiota bacterium]MDD5541372.1 bifunctional phosphoribosyl-AMP cyclohydrolase/phosphoribosyl-ATP diphosph
MNIDFEKNDGLVPAIIQDETTGKVLMLGYMNRESYEKTRATGKVTFFSRSRQTLWTKGETSGNFMEVREILSDCDDDTLLVKVKPSGPTCHTGSDTCFNEKNVAVRPFIYELEEIIRDRRENPKVGSYTNELFDAGIKRIAQKVGEEATEVVIDAVSDNIPRMQEEVADLLYHLLVLLNDKNVAFDNVMNVLEKRHKK